MKKEKAIQMAIVALEEQIKRIASQANLYDQYHHEHSKIFSDKRKLYQEAIEILKTLL